MEARVGIGPLSLDSGRNYPRFANESSLSKGVYVDTVDKAIYRGPILQRWDYFKSTARASAYIGCDTDQVADAFREGEFLGRGGEFTINGVRFMPASFINELFRPPLTNPKPPRRRRVLPPPPAGWMPKILIGG